MSTQKTVYIENYGCPSNRFDLEIIIAALIEGGYAILDSPDFADIFFINTCGVKKPTEDRILSRLQLLQQSEKPIIISGCLPKINLQQIITMVPTFAAVLDPFSLDQVSTMMEQIESGKRNLIFFSDTPTIKLHLPRCRMNRVIDIMQISEGCLGTCTFCCTRFARRTLFSYPIPVIVNQVHHAVQEGRKEIWLTSQDTGIYGQDQNTSLAELLTCICSIKGFFKIRVGMMNPGHIHQSIDVLSKAFKHTKIFKFLHLPLQSGNDEILRSMNRFYTVDDFKSIIHTFRQEIPEITLATDMICGFPTEDETAFQDSLRIIKEVKPDIVNVSKFFSRPRTIAAKMKQHPTQIVKRRSRQMSQLVKDIAKQQNQKWLHWRGDILIDEKGKNRSWIGRNFAYKPIVVHSEKDLWGQHVNIYVENVFPTYLEATIVNYPEM
jgi:MiaB-like tRNA modifying enzyme